MSARAAVLMSHMENNVPYGNTVSNRLSQLDERLGQIRVLAGADRKHQSAVAVLRDVRVPHGAVDVNALPDLQGERRIELQMDLDAAFEHVNKFFALMTNQLAELRQRVRPDPTQNGYHALVAQIRA